MFTVARMMWMSSRRVPLHLVNRSRGTCACPCMVTSSSLSSYPRDAGDNYFTENLMCGNFVKHKMLVSGVDSNWRGVHSASSSVTCHCVHVSMYSTVDGPCKENVAYCDGSCLGNGQKDAVAGIGVYWGPDSKYNISEPIKVDYTPTNNQAELMAVIRTVQSALEKNFNNVTIYTDSQYALLSAKADLTKRKDIPNRKLIVKLQKMCKHKDIKVTLIQVKAHSDCMGNKMADKLARDAAKSLL